MRRTTHLAAARLIRTANDPVKIGADSQDHARSKVRSPLFPSTPLVCILGFFTPNPLPKGELLWRSLSLVSPPATSASRPDTERHPSGITSVTTSQPIAKVGYLATPPGELFAIDITTESRLGERRPTRVSGSLFLVDGLLVPGNSGSPLVLPSELKVRRAPDSNQLQFATEQTKNYIIGIVSMGLDGSGLTLVYSADYILETVSLCLKGKREKPPA